MRIGDRVVVKRDTTRLALSRDRLRNGETVTVEDVFVSDGKILDVKVVGFDGETGYLAPDELDCPQE